MGSKTAHRDNETRCRRGTACNLLFIGTWKGSGAEDLPKFGTRRKLKYSAGYRTIRRQRCRSNDRRHRQRVHAYKKKDTGATTDAPGSPHSPARAAGVEEHHHDAQNAHSRHRRRRAGTGAAGLPSNNAVTKSRQYKEDPFCYTTTSTRNPPPPPDLYTECARDTEVPTLKKCAGYFIGAGYLKGYANICPYLPNVEAICGHKQAQG